MRTGGLWPWLPPTGKKEDCEVSEARSLLANPGVNLQNAVVTLDPLHDKKQTARVIIEKGGDYLIGTKKNTPLRRAAAQKALAAAPLLISEPKKATDASKHVG